MATVGYRFVCPVEVVEDAHGGLAHSGAGRYAPRTAGQPASSRKMLWTALAVSGLVVAGATGWMWYTLRPLPTLRIVSYTQITTDGQRKSIAGTDGSSLYLNLYVPACHGVVPVIRRAGDTALIHLPTT